MKHSIARTTSNIGRNRTQWLYFDDTASVARRRGCILWRPPNRGITLPRGRHRCRHVRGWTCCNSPILRTRCRWVLRWGLRPIGGGWTPIGGCITCGASKAWAQTEGRRRPNLAANKPEPSDCKDSWGTHHKKMCLKLCDCKRSRYMDPKHHSYMHKQQAFLFGRWE